MLAVSEEVEATSLSSLTIVETEACIVVREVDIDLER